MKKLITVLLLAVTLTSAQSYDFKMQREIMKSEILLLVKKYKQAKTDKQKKYIQKIINEYLEKYKNQ